MPYFDRFDIVEAWWLFALDFGEYHLVSRIFDLIAPGHLRPNLDGRDDLEENGQEIYDQLVARAEAAMDERMGPAGSDGRRPGCHWWVCVCPKEHSYATGLPGGTVARRLAAT